MNFVDLGIFILFLLIVFEGYARGFIVSLLSLVRFAVGIPVSFLIADKYASVIYAEHFRQSISNNIMAEISSSGVDTYTESVRNSLNSLPDFFKGAVNTSFLDNVNSSSLADGLMENIVDPIAEIISKAAVFVIAVFVFYVVTGIILFVVKKLSNSKKAPLRKTNKFLGAVFGMIKALIFVFAIAKIGSFLTQNINAGDNSFLQQLGSSAIIEFVNKFNPIMII